MRKTRLIGLILVLVCSTMLVNTQAQVRSRVAKLRSFAAQRSQEFKQRKAEAVHLANERSIPLFIKTKTTFMELQYFDGDMPVYYQTSNANAAKTISTDKVLPGGSSGLNLDGSGITIREWDGGAIRLTHQEYGNRAVQGDSPSSTHYHAAHVAGTMIASGVQASAKGMAPAANLRAFDWNNDIAEMATEASNGALMSNHSYGYSVGWTWTGYSWSWYGNSSISSQEDYRFGLYTSDTKQYDQVAHDAPYYLIVKAAGNDRGDGPSGGQYPKDGPYDCLGPTGVAKNVLTVGAVNDITGGYSQVSDVTMSSFSSWGPVDDGRIKPDICANGVGVYSTDDSSNSGYRNLDGTSMATPSVTGSIALLQQHYQAKKGSGQFMKSATAKALVIHTADEAGPNVGPDYMFGWGLMNTKKAADKITEDDNRNVIDELTLNNGATYTRTVAATGNQPLRVTVVWNDVPPTNVAPNQLDPANVMLMNDLDVTITRNGTTYYPWKLNRTNHSAAATNNSKNSVDNVEVIDIANPSAADYVITVSHVGTLSGGNQDFSIIISGIGGAVQPQKPVANFTASSTNVTVGGSVTFTDNSTNNPTSWSWTFVGGTPSSSTQQNPVITYSSAGTYAVTLNATNAQGTGTITKNAYITVADKQYCSSAGENVSDEWIKKVTIGNFVKSSGAQKYSDFTSETVTLAKGVATNIELVPGYSGTAYNEYWKIWVDLNGDKDFDDPNELVYDHGAKAKNAITGSLTIPVSATATTTRMRVSMKYNGAQTQCETFDYGEVEDYTVNLTASVQPPAVPANVSASNITKNSFTVSWNSVSAATSYTVQVRETGGSWSDNSVSAITYNHTGATPATTYEYRVKAVNAGGSSNYSTTKSLTTLNDDISYCSSKGKNVSDEYIDYVSLGGMTNTTAANGGYGDFTSKEATIARGATERLRVSAGFTGSAYTEYWAAWIDFDKDGVFESTEKVLTGSSSSSGTLYDDFTVPSDAVIGKTRMRVSMKYNSAQTACETFNYGEVEDYTVNITAASVSAFSDTSIGDGEKIGNEQPTKQLIVTPNPTNGKFTIVLTNSADKYVRIYSSTGKLVKTIVVLDRKIDVDITDFANGLYYVKVRTTKGDITKKILKY